MSVAEGKDTREVSSLEGRRHRTSIACNTIDIIFITLLSNFSTWCVTLRFRRITPVRLETSQGVPCHRELLTRCRDFER